MTSLRGGFSHSSPFTPAGDECFLPDPISFVQLDGTMAEPGSFYFLVVPVTGGLEGSFGETDLDGDGVGDGERVRPEDDPADAVQNGCP